MTRIMASFEKKGPNECWPWIARLSRYGYGWLWIGRHVTPNRVHAHRFMFQLRYGRIPDGLQACHHCDNRRCVNPHHVFLGTHKDNAQDRERKGRGNHRATPRPQNRGTRNGNCRLKDDDIARLRQMSKDGFKGREIAETFKISLSGVYLILNGKTHWNTLPA